MRRLRALVLATMAGLALGSDAFAIDPGSNGDPAFWNGFYLGILGGVGSDIATSTSQFHNLGISAGAGATTNDGFYFGAEAFLAGESFNGGAPYLWLEADGRVGIVVNDRVLFFGSGGVAYDTDASAMALTGGGGAEFAVTDTLSVRGQYSVQYYPSGLGTFHQGIMGLFWRLE